jgi:hypothetical protein
MLVRLILPLQDFSYLAPTSQYILAHHLATELTKGKVSRGLLGPIAALQAEFLLSFSLAPDHIKCNIERNILQLVSIFYDHKDDFCFVRPVLDETGPLPFTCAYFRDYYTLECLSLALTVAVRESCKPEIILGDAIQLGYYFLSLCVRQYCRPSDFTNRPGFSFVGRILELETAANNVVYCLEQQYLIHGSLKALDEATQLCRGALHLPITRSTVRHSLSCKLVSLLSHRVHALEDTTREVLIEEAISIAETCLKQANDGIERMHAHSYLSEAYKLQYRYHQLPDILATAIDHGRNALKEASGTHISSTSHQLSSILCLLFDAEHRLPDLDEAIELSQVAVQECAITSNNARGYLANMVALLFRRMEASPDTEVAHYAAECSLYIEETLKLSAHGLNAQVLLTKAQLLVSTKSPFHDNSASIDVMKKLVHDESYLPTERIKCVYRFWGETGSFDSAGFEHDPAVHQQLLELIVDSVHLLPRLATFDLDMSSRLDSLKHVAESLSMSAATSAVALHQFSLALEMLEEGRGIFWSQALNLRKRGELDGLPGEIRLSLIRCARELEKGSYSRQSIVFSPVESVKRELEASRKREIAVEFSQLVERARTIPGFERFMLPQKTQYLVKAAEKGPVILLTTMSGRCYALVITTSGDVVCPAMSKVSEHFLDTLTELWETTSRRMRHLSRNGLPVEEEAIYRINGIDQSMEEFLGSYIRAMGKRPKFGQTQYAMPTSQAVLLVLWGLVVRPILASLNLLVSTAHTPQR